MSEVDFFDFSQKIEAKKVVEKTKYEILNSLVQQCQKTDFRAKLHLELSGDELKEVKLKRPELKVLIIDEILDQAQKNNWSLCKQGGFAYLYNGSYWEILTDEDIRHFLSDCAERFGLRRVVARECLFVDELFKQFLFSAFIQPPEFNENKVLINLKNGTFETTTNEQVLREFRPGDFLTYQLPFSHTPNATAPMFSKYLDKVLPYKSAQDVLAEYCGYLFIRHGDGLKFEKCLILHGSGANGKSVFFEVLTALLGRENVSSYPLSDLTDKSGYYRAEIANKLLNYASEISKQMDSDLFKKLASGETFTARSPYGKPFEVRNYAKMIFNANELPRDTEQSNAFFRRFLIVPFDVTIPEAEQDRELHKKIIESELSGVFNWVLMGLKRLLSNKKFTDCQAIDETLRKYRTESDSVQMFLDEKDFQPSISATKLLKDLYLEYRAFCNEDGYRQCSNRTFSERLRAKDFEIKKTTGARTVFIEQKTQTDDPLPF